MKIGILTFPLNYNYGNLLQAFALLTYLKNEGNVVELINYPVRKQSVKGRLKGFAKFIIKTLFKKHAIIRHPQLFVHSGFESFIAEKINPKSEAVFDEEQLIKLVSQKKYDLVIVGSDQVWRKDYLGKRLPLYFLSFVDSDVRKIAYSASFGVDYWQFNQKETDEIQNLLRRFSAISVREKSGVKLCEENLRLQVKHIVDPSFLLKLDDYIKLTNPNKFHTPNEYIFTYLLDENETMKQLVREAQNIKDINDKISFSLLSVRHNNRNIEQNKPIEYWLHCIYHSKFVVTNSFHGTAFALLLNKPFVTVVNQKRGLTRFYSLLKMFDLEYRLINENSIDKLNTICKSEINWNDVNAIIENKRNEAKRFLTENLKN